MTDRKKHETPEDLTDATLDGISGGPTEELFGNYHFKPAPSAERTVLTTNENITTRRLD